MTLKASFFTGWSKGETITVFSLLAGFMFLMLILLWVPVKELALASQDQSQIEPVESSKKVAQAQKKGMFRFGKLTVSLAARDEFLDSDLDIEYDLGVMRVSADGSIKDVSDANKFCEKHKSRMKDAIITAISSVSVQKIKAVNGYDDFKSIILDAVNETLADSRSPFTNVFFRKFVLFPAES